MKGNYQPTIDELDGNDPPTEDSTSKVYDQSPPPPPVEPTPPLTRYLRDPGWYYTTICPKCNSTMVKSGWFSNLFTRPKVKRGYKCINPDCGYEKT